MGPPDLLVPDADLVALIRARLAAQRHIGGARAGATGHVPCAVDHAAAVDEDERVRQAAIDAFFGRTPSA